MGPSQPAGEVGTRSTRTILNLARRISIWTNLAVRSHQNVVDDIPDDECGWHLLAAEFGR